MDFSGIKRAANAWHDRRTAKKFSIAAHVMNHAAHTNALLTHLTSEGMHMTAANEAASAAKWLGNTSGRTAKRIDKLAANPELKAKVDKTLGLQQPDEPSSPWTF